MATKKRVWFPGATYHIVCRGNHKEIIFKEEIILSFTKMKIIN